MDLRVLGWFWRFLVGFEGSCWISSPVLSGFERSWLDLEDSGWIWQFLLHLIHGFGWILRFLSGFGASWLDLELPAGPDPSFCMDLEFPAGSDPSFPAGPGVHGHAGLGCEPAGAHGDHQGHAGVQP